MQNIINLISNNLKYTNGIWYSNINTIISYPKEGNDSCFEIEENSFWFKHRNDCILELVKKYATKPLFIDVGGGNGFTSLHLQKNNIETILLEPGSGIYNAQSRGLTHLICSSFNDEIFNNNSIPNFGIFDVLEHIENDRIFLQDIFNKLESQGRVFITVPAYSFLWSNDDVEAGHYRRYTLKSLKKLLQDIGFKIEYESYFFSILIFPIFMFRL